jgi:hypothetical protein
MKGQCKDCGGHQKTPKLFGSQRRETSNLVKGKSAKVPDGRKAKR